MTEASRVHARNQNQDDEGTVHPSCHCKLPTLGRSLPHQAERHLDTYPPSQMMLACRQKADQSKKINNRDVLNSPHAV
jgi:hypothetical protein